MLATLSWDGDVPPVADSRSYQARTCAVCFGFGVFVFRAVGFALDFHLDWDPVYRDLCLWQTV